MAEQGKEANRLRQRKTPRQERSIQRLEAILDAVRRLIVANGIGNLKMTEIAAEAGIPIGSLYQFFPEKAAVIRALHDDLTTRVERGTEQTFAEIRSIDAAENLITQSVDRFYESFRENAIYLSVWRAAVSDRDLEPLNRLHFERMAAILSRVLLPLLPPGFQGDFEMRLTQMVHLSGSVVRFALSADEATARRALQEWKRTVKLTLFTL